MDQQGRLVSALLAGEWGAVSALLNDNLFRYLFDAPDLLHRVFEAAPDDFYDRHPRHVMSRAIAAAIRRPVLMIDPQAQAQFRAWVQGQESPALRDVFLVLMAQIRQALFFGSYDVAARAAGQILGLLRTQAEDTDGFEDLLPVVLIECGLAKLLTTNADSALICFREAYRWATIGRGHPVAQYAREHLALCYALSSWSQKAADALPDEEFNPPEPGSAHDHYGKSGIIARAFIAIGGLDFDRAEDLIECFERTPAHNSVTWLVIHARAQIALWRGDPRGAIHALEGYMVGDGARTLPQTAIGTVLRADLASLYQAAGELRNADVVLGTPGLIREHPALLAPSVRQQLLRGRPASAREVLQSATVGTGLPAQTTPFGSVIHAVTTHVATGSVPEEELNAVASSMNHHRAYFPLFQVPADLRQMLAPLLDVDVPDGPFAFAYRPRIRLTSRERELLVALTRHATVDEIATSLHISTNTARTHVRTMYRKLGAHTRDEALQLGRNLLPPEQGV